MLTKYFLEKTKGSGLLDPQPEITPGGQDFTMFNTGGVELEVGELLYSLIRIWKPLNILETGTHLGISSAYLAQGLVDNKKGKLATYEVIPSLQQQAKKLWQILELNSVIDSHLRPSLKAEVKEPLDFLFLDSEPQYRFDEFLYFWPFLKEGSLIVIHDLHSTLGKSGLTHAGMDDWPYGPWREKLGKYVKENLVQVFHFPSPRGLTIFQKTKLTDENIALLKGQ